MAMSPALPRSSAPPRWQDYVQLLKPRVMSLVIFTAITGLICANAPINPVLAGVAEAAHRHGKRWQHHGERCDRDGRVQEARNQPEPDEVVGEDDAPADDADPEKPEGATTSKRRSRTATAAEAADTEE